MAALEINDKEIRLKDLKPLAIPAAAVLLIIGLYVVGARIAIGQINEKRDELSVARKDERTLQQKQQILSEMSDDVLSLVDVSSNALPGRNPSLVMISQIRQLTSQRLLSIRDLSIGRSVVDGSLRKVQLQFEVDGDLNQLIFFIRQLAAVAPLSRLNSVSINQSGGAVRADISITTYSAPFPEELPAIKEPLSGLTAQEEEVLGTLSELQAPPFSTSVSPSQPSGGRANPFE